MTTAALGGSIDVPLLSQSRVAVSIPAGTETGKQFRIKGKGMPVLRSNVKGDMYIQVEVETPRHPASLVGVHDTKHASVSSDDSDLGDSNTVVDTRSKIARTFARSKGRSSHDYLLFL